MIDNNTSNTGTPSKLKHKSSLSSSSSEMNTSIRKGCINGNYQYYYY